MLSILSAPIIGYERFIFWFWESPNNRLTCMQGQNSFIVLWYAFICNFFSQRLPSDSLNDSIFQTHPLRDANLRWLVDWSHFNFIIPVMPDKAAFVSAVLLCLQRCLGNSCFTAVPSGKEWILYFHSDQRKKTNKSAGNILIFHVDVNLK